MNTACYYMYDIVNIAYTISLLTYILDSMFIYIVRLITPHLEHLKYIGVIIIPEYNSTRCLHKTNSNNVCISNNSPIKKFHENLHRELERVCSQTQLCQWRCSVTILDNYMFRPLLAIFRLSSRELNVPTMYNVRARDGEISTSGFCCVIINYILLLLLLLLLRNRTRM